jgi:phage host-nuclease inhibitor protein Gam
MKKAEMKQMAALAVEDVEALVREMCIASVRHDEALARMNEEIERARQNHEPELTATQATWDNLFASVQIWAEAHPELFASRKSIAMVHGTVGFRTGQPSLRPVRGMTWEKVVDALRQIAPAFVRRREEADRQALAAAAAEDGGTELLGRIGLRLHQEQRFFVDPNKDAAKIEQAKPAKGAA